MSSSSLKDLKQDFVTGHAGTSVWELILVCGSAPLGIWLFGLLQNFQKNNTLRILVARNMTAATTLEAILVLFPMALAQTSLLYPCGVIFMCLEFFTASWLYYYNNNNNDYCNTQETSQNEGEQQQTAASSSSTRLPFITCYRSSVCFLTFVAILAVDFHVFPRRFAKTEVYGYGLMDLGAGSFVVAAGLVSKQRNNHHTIKLKRLIPLLVMGWVRYYTNKAVEYQEHVSEYGRHWNFFFTLAVIPILARLLQSDNTILQWVNPILLLILYQLALSKYGLQEYVEDAPRDCQVDHSTYYYDLVCDAYAANREGILGCVGYTSLYMLSQQVGRTCLWSSNSRNEQQGKRLITASACLWLLHWSLTFCAQVSRRSTNLTFCVWTLAHNVLILTLLYYAGASTRTTTTTSLVPPIFQAVNRHGLLVFVVANLLTGIVNLSMNTLEASDEVALLVVFSYLCVVGGFALLVDAYLPRIKNMLFKQQPKSKEE